MLSGGGGGERADVEYVRILHLAATTMEATVDDALALLLEVGQPFEYGAVRELALAGQASSALPDPGCRPGLAGL